MILFKRKFYLPPYSWVKPAAAKERTRGLIFYDAKGGSSLKEVEEREKPVQIIQSKSMGLRRVVLYI